MNMHTTARTTLAEGAMGKPTDAMGKPQAERHRKWYKHRAAGAMLKPLTTGRAYPAAVGLP